jgi:hypothetical protein
MDIIWYTAFLCGNSHTKLPSVEGLFWYGMSVQNKLQVSRLRSYYKSKTPYIAATWRMVPMRKNAMLCRKRKARLCEKKFLKVNITQIFNMTPAVFAVTHTASPLQRPIG